MHFDYLDIKNYRAIKALKLENLGLVNIITGENNVGKSSVLEAAYLLGEAISTETTFLVTVSEIRNEVILTNQELTQFFYNFDASRSITIESNQLALSFTTIPDFVTNEEERGGVKTSVSLKNSNKSFEIKTLVKQIPNGVNRQTQISGRPPTLEDQECFYYKTSPMSNKEFTSILGNILKNKERQNLVEIFKTLDNRVVDITPIYDKIFIDIGFPALVSLNLVGDGLKKLCHLAVVMYHCRDHILIIDEIENGFHYSFYPKLWENLVQLAKLLNVQLFIASHSYECIKGVEPLLTQNNDVKLYNILYDKNEHRVAPASTGKMKNLLQNEVEIR